MKKLLILISIISLSVTCSARPHSGPGFHHRGFRPPPPPVHHHSYWGRGESHFWPGFVGGFVGSAIINSCYRPIYNSPVVVTPPVTTVITPAPVITTTPVYVPPQRVWVAGHYETRYYPNGQPYQVWIEGYWK